MKTFTRMIRRYVLATAAVVLLVVGLLLGAVVYLGLHYGEAADSRVRIGTLAEALTPTADGLQLDPARTPADWLQGYAWATARATRLPCCTPCRPVKRGRIRPTFWVCTSSSRSSAPTAARRPLPGAHRAGQRRCWCCR